MENKFWFGLNKQKNKIIPDHPTHYDHCDVYAFIYTVIVLTEHPRQIYMHNYVYIFIFVSYNPVTVS